VLSHIGDQLQFLLIHPLCKSPGQLVTLLPEFLSRYKHWSMLLIPKFFLIVFLLFVVRPKNQGPAFFLLLLLFE